MSSKKGQNSILLLTTLGVYLGLLMAGATPGVIAQQAALTRNFELSEEFEAKDDLDKDPQDAAAESDAVDIRSLELVVSSYLSRVLDTCTGLPPHDLRAVAAKTRFAEKRTAPLTADFTAADVQNSSNFTSQRFARAGL